MKENLYLKNMKRLKLKAKIKPGYDENRLSLKDVVPMDTPFTLFISPSQLCNFKCHYCAHSLSPETKRRESFVSKNLEWTIFQKIVDQAKVFPKKFKRILLTGLGEPLMNPDISKMVHELKEAKVSDNLEIFTNASYLNEELSTSLINSGLTKLRISIQGTDATKYYQNCGMKIDFDSLVKEIKYFYKISRGKCSVYIKIIEEELEGERDEEKFFNIFQNICDEIFVENLVKAQPLMGDYNNTIVETKTFFGEKAENREVCPYIFYTLQIDSEGNCFPCPPLSLPKNFSLGNVKTQSLTEIWNGKKHQELMFSHLLKDESKCELCKRCVNYLCFTPKEDNLDDDTMKIIEKIKRLDTCH